MASKTKKFKLDDKEKTLFYVGVSRPGPNPTEPPVDTGVTEATSTAKNYKKPRKFQDEWLGKFKWLSQAQELLKIIKGQYFSKFISRDGKPKVEPVSLPWYPDELAWQIDFTKKEIRNDSTLKTLHGFLVSETESGNISRQEAVSMLPPLLMDIQPHHKILDMCAAPGSKTAQLIEMLHRDETVPVPDGFVVANDMDNKRCYLMTHQVKRIQSPNCMIINHDARILPNMVTSKDENAEFVKYDRILCDVPCSGDGTMRKNPDIWKKWHVNGGYNLHRIQKKVLQRGLELLAVGGRLVYSTCSLNPIEDEAVILTLIKQCGGAVEVVDVSDKLTGLKYSKGTYSWKLMSKKGEWYETEDQAPEHFKSLWDSTMYPPIITEAQDAKLERCIRILPHQQNTGAFFIAVLQKTSELPWVAARASRRKDPVINPKLRQDAAEMASTGSEYFAFSVKSRKGAYMYAECLLCHMLLQNRRDYDSHRLGKKHRSNLAIKESKKTDEAPETTPKESKQTTDSAVNMAGDTETDNDACSNESGNKRSVMTEEGDEGVCSDTKTDMKTDESSKTVSDTTIQVNTEIENNEPRGESACSSNENGDGSMVKGENTCGLGEGDAGKLGEEGNGLDPPPEKRLKLENDEEIPVRIQGYKEDPFIFCSTDDPVWPAIKNFYDLKDSLAVEQIMYRNMKRVLYYVAKPIRNLVICNDDRVKFINLGVKCFSNAPSPLVPECDYRLSQEGLQAIQQHVNGRRVTLTKQDVITILSSENPFICKLSPLAQEHVHAMDPGSALFHFKPNEMDPEPNVEIVFCGWRGKTSVRSFVGKDERSHYLRLCGVELTDIQSQVQAMKAEKSLHGEVLPVAGTETPVGIPSGDEAEVEQWNEEEAQRVKEEDDYEEDPSPLPGCSATTGEATLNDEAMEDDVNQNEEQLEKRTDGIPVTRNNGTDKSS